MVGESQHTAWRKDIMNNLKKAMEAGDDSVRREIALAMIDATSKVMIAERIGQLAWALNRNDEVISELHDRITTGEQIAERLVAALQLMDEKGELSEGAVAALTMIEDWLVPDGPVKFNPPSPSS